MATWFGHTQTISTLSKSVTTVAGGVLNLESNVSAFMKKVIYYEQFFNRVSSHLPPEVTMTAKHLLAQCFEYRDQLRDELESKIAYVADAGRWLIGMEDWNSKMERCLGQINELVLLANSLLIEFAVTGAIGASGSKEELVAYLQQIKSSSNMEKPFNDSRIQIPETHDCKRYQATTKCQKESANKCGSTPCKDRETEVDREMNDDEDEMNPFTKTKKVLEPLPPRASIQDTCESDVADFCKEPKVQGDCLSDFECLSRESIPEYLAFKKTTLRRKFKATQKDARTECFREGAHSLSTRQTRIGSDTVKQSQQTEIGSASGTYSDNERENAWNPFAENGEATGVRLTAAESNSKFTPLCPN